MVVLRISKKDNHKEESYFYFSNSHFVMPFLNSAPTRLLPCKG